MKSILPSVLLSLALLPMPGVAQDLVAGGATVVVQVWGTGGRGDSVTVDVHR